MSVVDRDHHEAVACEVLLQRRVIGAHVTESRRVQKYCVMPRDDRSVDVRAGQQPLEEVIRDPVVPLKQLRDVRGHVRSKRVTPSRLSLYQHWTISSRTPDGDDASRRERDYLLGDVADPPSLGRGAATRRADEPRRAAPLPALDRRSSDHRVSRSLSGP
jgi:hypothetical protein